MPTAPLLPTVLVVPARPDGRGWRAATNAVDLLAGLADARVAAPDHLPGLCALLGAVDHVVVLDPGRWRARFTSHPALGAPGRAADRLALLRVLRARTGRVRWIGRPDQWDALREALSCRPATTGAVRP